MKRCLKIKSSSTAINFWPLMTFFCLFYVSAQFMRVCLIDINNNWISKKEIVLIFIYMHRHTLLSFKCIKLPSGSTSLWMFWSWSFECVNNWWFQIDTNILSFFGTSQTHEEKRVKYNIGNFMANINLLRKILIKSRHTGTTKARWFACDLLHQWKKGPTNQHKTHSKVLWNDSNT